MNTSPVESKIPTFKWWATHRLRFNLILLAAAPISFACLLLIWATLGDRLPCFEVTAFTATAGVVLFALGLALANAIYFLGPIAERLIAAQQPAKLRYCLFAAGTGFSVLLIFSPVLGNLLVAFVGAAVTGSCV